MKISPRDLPHADQRLALIDKRSTAVIDKLPQRLDCYRSQWERDYAKHLAMREAAGEIRWWFYESVRLKIGTGAAYTPDFVVAYRFGDALDLEFHEVKGHRREASIVRLKVASSLYPFRFFIVTKERGAWKVEEVRK